MREGILQSLEPFLVKEDSFSGVLMHTIKRLLGKADIVDLTNVLISADTFIEEMRPFLDEYNGYQEEIIRSIQRQTTAEPTLSYGEKTHDRGNDPNSGRPGDRQGNPGWKDEVRKIHAATVPDTDILQEVPTEGEGASGGYKTEMEGHHSSNGSTPISEIS